MKFLRSFRFRLAAWSAMISGLVLLVFGAVAGYTLYEESIDALDDEMERFAEDLVEEIEEEDRFDRDDLVDLFDLFDDRKSLHLVAVVTPRGKPMFRSSHWRNFIFDGHRSGSSSHRTVRHDGDRWRLSRIEENRWKVYVATHLGDLAAAQRKVLTAFAVAFPLSLIFAAIGGLLLARRALRPVEAITRTAERIDARELDQRVPDRFLRDDEIGRLGTVLNSMFVRLEAGFEQTARFSADASHELNTPLAVMQGELEQTMQRDNLTTDEVGLLTNLLEETQRLKTITRSLLLFSRSDAGNLPLELAEFNLSEFLNSMIEDIRVLDLSKSLGFKIEIEEALPVRGDETLLRQAFYNILHNAVRYNWPNGRVKVSFSKIGSEIVGRISNTGPGISARNIDRVFDRFFREDVSRNRGNDGFGLGLPLAREIVRAHGGDIILERSDDEETVFVCRVPAATAETLP
jgi:signal transduction histidine kinase